MNLGPVNDLLIVAAHATRLIDVILTQTAVASRPSCLLQ